MAIYFKEIEVQGTGCTITLYVWSKMERGKSFMHDRKWDSCRQRLLFANIYCEKGVSACKVSFPL